MFGSINLMSSLMKIAGKFIGKGDKVAACNSVVEEFCTPDNIAMAANAITAGIVQLEFERREEMVLQISKESIGAGIHFIQILVFNRNTEKPIFRKVLNEITQADLIHLSTLIGTALNNAQNG